MGTPTEQQPVTLEQAEKIVEIYTALMALKKDKNYQLVFEKHLFNDEVIRLHGLMAHKESSLVASQEEIIKDLDALSNVKFALQVIEQIGSMTKSQLDDFRAAQHEAQSAGE